MQPVTKTITIIIMALVIANTLSFVVTSRNDGHRETFWCYECANAYTCLRPQGYSSNRRECFINAIGCFTYHDHLRWMSKRGCVESLEHREQLMAEHPKTYFCDDKSLCNWA